MSLIREAVSYATDELIGPPQCWKRSTLQIAGPRLLARDIGGCGRLLGSRYQRNQRACFAEDALDLRYLSRVVCEVGFRLTGCEKGHQRNQPRNSPIHDRDQ